jgi:hypothetical protein
MHDTEGGEEIQHVRAADAQRFARPLVQSGYNRTSQGKWQWAMTQVLQTNLR